MKGKVPGFGFGFGLFFTFSIFIFLSSCKKDPPLFSYSKTIGAGFSRNVQLLFLNNKIYYYDTFNDVSTFGTIDATNGTKTQLVLINTNEQDFAFDGNDLFYLKSDSIYQYTTASQKTKSITKLSYPSSAVSYTHTIAVDDQFLYYTKYELVQGFINYSLYKHNKVTGEASVLFAADGSGSFAQDASSIYTIKKEVTRQWMYDIIKINKQTGTSQIVVSGESLTMWGVDNNKLCYKADSVYGETPTGNSPFSYNGNCFQGPRKYVFENGFVYELSNDWGGSVEILLTKTDMKTGSKTNIASSAHGITNVITTDDQYIYVLDKSGAIGLIKL